MYWLVSDQKDNNDRESCLIVDTTLIRERQSSSWAITNLQCLRVTRGAGQPVERRPALEDFLNRPEEFGEFIVSSSFTVSGPNDLTTWELKLYPKGDILSHGNYVSIDLINKEGNTEKAHFSLSILNDSGQKENTE